MSHESSPSGKRAQRVFREVRKGTPGSAACLIVLFLSGHVAAEGPRPHDAVATDVASEVASGRPGSIVLVSSSDAFADDYLLQQTRESGLQPNVRFLEAALDALCLHPGLQEIQARPVPVHALKAAVESRRPDEKPIVALSPGSKTIVKELRDVMHVVLHASEKLPPTVAETNELARGLLRELIAASGGKIRLEVVEPETAAAARAAEQTQSYLAALKRGETPKEPRKPIAIQDLFGARRTKTDDEIRQERRRMAQQISRQERRPLEEVVRELLEEEFRHARLAELSQLGVEPYMVTEREASRVRQHRVYMHLEIRYLDRQPEVLPCLVAPERLEYEILRRVARLVHRRPPVLAFLDGSRREAARPPSPPPPIPPSPPGASGGAARSRYKAVIEYLGRSYDVRSTGTGKPSGLRTLLDNLVDDVRREARERGEESPLPALEGDARYGLLAGLIVAHPDALEKPEVEEIRRVVSAGVSTLFFISRHSVDAGHSGAARGLPISKISLGNHLKALLDHWGVRVEDGLVASNDCAALNVQRTRGNLSPRVMAPTPIATCVEARLTEAGRRSPLTSGVSKLILPVSSPLRLDRARSRAAGFTVAVLAHTSAQSWIGLLEAGRGNAGEPSAGPTETLVSRAEDLVLKKDPATFRSFVDPVPLVVLLQAQAGGSRAGRTTSRGSASRKPGTGARRAASSLPTKVGGSPSFRAIDFDAVRRIVLAKGDSEPVVLEKSGDVWVVASAWGYPADRKTVYGILGSLAKIGDAEVRGRSRESHGDFEVDATRGGVLRLLDASGRELGRLIVGKMAQSRDLRSSRVFVRFGADDTVYEVESSIRSDARLWADVRNKNYLQKEVFQLARELEVVELRLSRPGERDLVVTRKLVQAEEGEGRSPTRFRESFAVVSGDREYLVGKDKQWLAKSLLDRCRQLRIEDVAEPRPAGVYGLDKPRLSVTARYRRRGDSERAAAGTVTLLLGNPVNEENEEIGRYLALAEPGKKHRGRVYIMSKWMYQSFDKKLQDLVPAAR